MERLTRRKAFAAGGAAAASALTAVSATAGIDGRSRAQLLRRPYKTAADGEEREYYVYLPVGYHTEEGRRWPVMMFLHGNGERGDGRDDLQYTMIHGPLMEAWTQGRDLPFVIVQPQLPWFSRRRPEGGRNPPPIRTADGPPPERNYGSRSDEPMRRAESGEAPRWGQGTLPDGWDVIDQDLLAMVDATLDDFRGDAERVYLTGLSYGGFGTWHMASTYPERWAAVAPICGAGVAAKVPAIAKAGLPIWIFQGGRDPVVQAEYVLATARALEDAGHPEVRMTVHEDLGHNVWTRVYEGSDLYDWFLRKRRGSTAG